MATSNQLPPVIEFCDGRACFQGPAHQSRVAQLIRKANLLTDKATADRDRLKVRARL